MSTIYNNSNKSFISLYARQGMFDKVAEMMPGQIIAANTEHRAVLASCVCKGNLPMSVLYNANYLFEWKSDINGFAIIKNRIGSAEEARLILQGMIGVDLMVSSKTVLSPSDGEDLVILALKGIM